jgi:hypothetical protein
MLFLAREERELSFFNGFNCVGNSPGIVSDDEIDCLQKLTGIACQQLRQNQ